MSTTYRTSCDDCGFTGGPYRSQKQADYALTRHSCDRQRMLQARQARVNARKTSSGPTRDCTHLDDHGQPRHHHGDRNAYVLDKCRCRPCRDAARVYENRRAKDRAYGRQAYVPANHARTHVLHLMSQGMGWKRIAAAAGVENSVVWKLLYSDTSRNMPPSRRCRPATAEKLLAVTLDLAPGATIDGTGTRRRLQALAVMGWSQSKLATRLGMQGSNLGPIIHGRRDVTQATADAVKALYDDLWATPAPPSGRHGAVPIKTRNHAARMGWVGPLAWDDDTIDDPQAVPDTGGKVSDLGSGRRKFHLDDLEHLLDTAGPWTWDGITTRLGVTRSAIEHACGPKRGDRPDLLARIQTSDRSTAA